MSENWPFHPVPWDDELLSEWIRWIAESWHFIQGVLPEGFEHEPR
jgi:hypothetical protein